MAIFDFFKRKKNKVDENDSVEIEEQLEEQEDDVIDDEILEVIEEETNKLDLIEQLEAQSLESDVIDILENEDLEEIDLDEIEFDKEDTQIQYLEDTLEFLGESYEFKDDINENEIDNEDVEDNPEEKKKGFFNKIISGLDKTRKNIMGNVESVLKSFTKIDDEFFEELEEALIMADIGVNTSMALIESIKDRAKKEKINDSENIKQVLIEEISKILDDNNDEFIITHPTVILVIGVNGVGKTTTIGKLAAKYKADGKNVVLAAADTFRAAAIDQLEVWGQRSNIPVIKHQENSDPGAVVYDAVQAAKSRKADILICDTAGRLHNKKNLMEELRKIYKIITREYPNAQIETFIVLDATTGQNALQQAITFKEICDITGIVLTKLDGTAKGGIIIAIKNELQIPVRYIGVGESIDDLQEFDSEQFAKALFMSDKS